MHDLIQAIEIALQFTPGSQMPGLEGVLFEFTDDGLRLYGCNGHTMIRLTLGNMGTGTTGEYFIGTEELKDAVERFVDAESTSVTAWDNSLMLMADDIVDTLKPIDCGYEGRHLTFFGEHSTLHGIKADVDLIHHCIMDCAPVLLGFSKHGPAVTFRPAGTMMVVSPEILPDLKHLKAIDIVIAQLEI